jgi:hypothetical protein
MKKFALAAVVASGLAAAILGLAGPAQAVTVAPAMTVAAPTGVDRLDWLDKIHPKPNVPKVDTSVRSHP